MTIRVLSLDFDGCLFHTAYVCSKNQHTSDRVIQCNKAFLDKLRLEGDQYAKTITFIGSNRQSKQIDDFNHWSPSRNYKGSCFPAIKTITAYLNKGKADVRFDSFLLADIYGELEVGTSYKYATNKKYHGNHAAWRFDETKLSILYAQMQKIASEHKDEEIQFDFYDDRRDILETLKTYFEKNPKSIPQNITLNLDYYAGSTESLQLSIKGTGEIDCHYKETIKSLGLKVSRQQCRDGYCNKIYFHKHVTDALIAEVKEEILNQKRKLFKAIQTLKEGPYKAFSEMIFEDNAKKQAVAVFVEELRLAIERFEKTNSPTEHDLNKLKRASHNAFYKADVTLRYYDNWIPLCQNLLLCLTLIGTALCVYSVYQRATTGRYSFFDSTKSDERLIKEKENIDDFNPFSKPN